ncbi:MAG TPA: preprotein translocase subunit SecE [Candidatus Omnitrophica bacterium]|nr:preprotein translocase subunit SecE [Candidatus Omnitrophota bacterium]
MRVQVLPHLLMWRKFTKYLQEVRKEMRKVSWSNRRIVWNSTILVLILSGISALYVGIVDILFSTLLRKVLK